MLFTENDKIMPEFFQILKYARFYAKEQFSMKIMLKAWNYAMLVTLVFGVAF